MNAQNEKPGEGWELVLPFVIVKSKGGPHDDDAFVSGWRLGRIAAAVEPSGAEWAGLVRADEIPQLDLIAMRRGLTLTSVDAPGGWVTVTLRHEAGDSR